MTSEVVRNHDFHFDMAAKFTDLIGASSISEVLRGVQKDTTILVKRIIWQTFDCTRL